MARHRRRRKRARGPFRHSLRFAIKWPLTNDNNLLLYLQVRLIGRERISEFTPKHPASVASLKAWQKSMEANIFKSYVELKKVFGSADYVKPHTVFNIGGNKYRLISLVDYELGAVSIEHVLTHPEYDKGKWRH